MSAMTIRDEFNQAIQPYHGALLHNALALTRDLDEARDLVQDALERALREWARFTPGTNVRAWVMTILSRLFIDGWRKRRHQPRFVSVEDVDPPASTFEHDEDPQQRWEALSQVDLKEAVAALSPRFRRVFELSAFHRLSYAEISATTGVRVSTVGTQLLRARRQLRALMLDRIASPERPATLQPSRHAELESFDPPMLPPTVATWKTRELGRS